MKELWYKFLYVLGIVEYGTEMTHLYLPYDNNAPVEVREAVRSFKGLAVCTDEGLWIADGVELIANWGTPIEYFKWTCGKKKGKKAWLRATGEKRVLTYTLKLAFDCMRVRFSDRLISVINASYSLGDISYFPYRRPTEQPYSVNRVARHVNETLIEYADVPKNEQITYKIDWQALNFGIDYSFGVVYGTSVEIIECLGNVLKMYKEQTTSQIFHRNTPPADGVATAEKILLLACQRTFVRRLQTVPLFRPEDGVEMSDALKAMKGDGVKTAPTPSGEEGNGVEN